MKVYLVEDSGNSPGKIYAIFEKEEEANKFADELYKTPKCICSEVIARKVWPSQPPIKGYNA